MHKTTPEPGDQLQHIVNGFLVGAAAARIEPLGAGLINATYRVDSRRGSFVLQRINSRVFPAPERIMANLSRLQALAVAHPELGVRLPGLVMATDGRPFVRDSDNHCWRMMEYIHPSRTLHQLQNQRQAAEIGRVLGRFHRLGAELNLDELYTTLPGFHHTPTYLAALETALVEGPQVSSAYSSAAVNVADSWPRLIDETLAFIADRRPLVDVLEEALGQGQTRMRVIHGDPKIDNLLFARDSDRALCLIDLDTVQPGLIQHDIGDCLRSCCNRVGEAAGGRTQVRFDLALGEAILAAYAEQMRHLLNATEVASICSAVQVIPFELGLRFLTDHLQGDRYFRVAMHGDNLRKAVGQFALVADIERKAEAIQAIVRRNFGASEAPDQQSGQKPDWS